MSLVRVGMSENKGYAEGYEAIFGKRPKGQQRPADTKAEEDKKAEAAGGCTESTAGEQTGGPRSADSGG